VVSAAAGEADERVVEEDRREAEHIRQVPVAEVGVVKDDAVAGPQRLRREHIERRAQRERHRPDLARGEDALRDELAPAVEEPDAAILRFPDRG